MPISIVLYWDRTLTNQFWQDIFQLQGTHINMRIAYHPQTDGQT